MKGWRTPKRDIPCEPTPALVLDFTNPVHVKIVKRERDNMTKVFTFHADAAHGWLEVSTSDLAQLGMIPASFSKYSYADRSGVTPVYYLEEDADASKFVAAWEAKNKAKIQTKEAYQNHSFIRNLGRISS